MNKDQLKDIMETNKDWLTELDSKAGDSDIGITMSHGFRETSIALINSMETDIGRMLFLAGRTMSITVPSTMGTLIGAGLMETGQKLKGKEQLELNDIVTWFGAMYSGVQRMGKAEPGEKTILDSLEPLHKAWVEASNSGDDIRTASRKAAIAAREGFEQTKEMIAQHGKAAAHGEKTKTFLDPVPLWLC